MSMDPNPAVEKKTIEVIVPKKGDPNTAPAERGRMQVAPASDAEVAGHWDKVWVECPHCRSVGWVALEYNGQWFDCNRCGNSFRGFV